MESSKPFLFLDLPPEIRTKIYHQICYTSQPISLSNPSQKLLDLYPHSLLLTSLQIYQEVRPIFYSINTFTLTIHRTNYHLLSHTLLSPTFASHRLLIRSLTIIIDRWGSKKFCVGELVPKLEEMVLGGRLRVLRVVMREGYLERGRRWLMGGLSGSEEGEGANYRALRRVLGDRDLEFAKLGTFGVTGERVLRKPGLVGEIGEGDDYDDFGVGRINDVTALFLSQD